MSKFASCWRLLCQASPRHRHSPTSLVYRPVHTSCVLRDRARQPTGRAGHIRPWMRTPFFHERGPPVGVDKSLQERLEDLYPEDPIKGEKVDIGFKSDKLESLGKGQVADWRRKTRADRALEKAAREGTLEVDLDVVRKQWVESGSVYEDIYEAAELYGLYEDMFDHGYFRPCTMLDIQYQHGEVMVPVHRGNIVKPGEAASAPQVKFDSGETGLWCLVMTGLDTHLVTEGQEYLHWMVGNIRGTDLGSGDTLCNYLQPFPPFGTGYHRFAFVLYRQEGEIDFGSESREESSGVSLEKRSFNTLDFYSKFQDQVTPAGLAFFQSDYETSVRDFFHKTLDMKEPRYEYEFPDWYVKPWNDFFHDNLKDGFDEFLDRHRDPKDIEREVMEVKLAHTNPFTGNMDSYIKYPGIHEEELEEHFAPPIGEKRFNPKQSFKIAQWRRNAIQKQRMKERYFRSMDHKDLRRDPSMNN
eukprot:GFUD01010898.1.p1 GENE.GFUD01010898.1~~GFUD01010898.1.p1  ORF type:complete len:470 (-),score=120.69 GFUD01010898.1:61-1470(-)